MKYILIIACFYIIFFAETIYCKETSYLSFSISTPVIAYEVGEEIPISISIKAVGEKDGTISKKIRFYAYTIDRGEITTIDSISRREIVRKREPEKVWDEKIDIEIRENALTETIAKTNIKLLNSGYYLIIAFLDNKESALKLQVTNIAIIVKTGVEKSIIWCVDMKGVPVGNSVVRILWKNKVLQEGKTNKDGIYEINLSKLYSFKIYDDLIIEVSKLGNYAYAILNLQARHDEEIPKIWITTDKPFYYLEDVIKFKAIFRIGLKNNLAIPKGEDVYIAIRDPKGKDVYQKKYKLDNGGYILDEFKIPPVFLPGVYTVIATLKAHTSKINFHVLKKNIFPFNVEISTYKRYYNPNEKVEFRILCEYPQGVPLSYALVKFQIKRYMQNIDDINGEVVYQGETKTDRKGRVQISFTPEKKDVDVKYRILVEASDQINQISRNFHDVYFLTLPIELFITTPKNVFQIGDDVNVNVSLLRKDDSVEEEKVNITVFKKSFEGDTVTKKIEVFRETHNIAKSKSIIFKPDTSGIFEINADIRKGEDMVKSMVDIYVIKPQGIDFALPKMMVIPEDTSKIIISTPFKNSYLLVTAEGEDVHFYKVIMFKDLPQILQIPQLNKKISRITISQLYEKKPLSYEYRFKEVDIIQNVSFDKEDKYFASNIANFSFNFLENKKISLLITAIDEDTDSIWKRRKLQSVFSTERKVHTKTSMFFLPVSQQEEIKIFSTFESGYDSEVLEYIPYRSYTPFFASSYVSGNANFQINFQDTGKQSSKKVVYVDAISDDGEVMTYKEKIQAYCPYEVNIISPSYVSLQDSFVVYLRVLNKSASTKDISVKITAENAEVKTPKEIKTTVERNDTKTIGWKIISKNKKNINIKTEVKIDDWRKDIDTTILVIPAGKFRTQPSFTIFDYTNKNITENDFVSSKKSPQDIRIKLFSDIESVISYFIEMAEDLTFLDTTLAKLQGVILLDRLHGGAKKEEIDNLLNILYSFQNDDGGFGISCKNKSDSTISSIVPYIVGKLKYSAYQEKDKALRRYLQKEYEIENDINKKVSILFSLTKLNILPPEWLIELNKQRHKLDIISLCRLTEMLFQSGLKSEARDLLDAIKKQGVATEEEYYFCYDINTKYSEKNVLPTAIFLHTLMMVDKDAKEIIQKIINYIYKGWKHSLLDSYLTSFFVLEAISDYITRSAEKETLLKISLNNKLIKEVKLTPQFKMQNVFLDKKVIKEGKNVLKLEKTGDDFYFYQIDFYNTDKKSIISPITISRSYVNITNPKLHEVKEDKAKKSKTPIKKEIFSGYIGDLVEVSNVISITQDIENIIFEEYLPSNFHLLKDKTSMPDSICVDYQKNKITYFSKLLKAGTYTMKYYAILQTVGNFYIPPAEARIFFYPEIIYRGKEERLIAEE